MGFAKYGTGKITGEVTKGSKKGKSSTKKVESKKEEVSVESKKMSYEPPILKKKFVVPASSPTPTPVVPKSVNREKADGEPNY